MASPEIERLREVSNELIGPELLGPLVEALPDALIIADDRGKIVLFNRQAELLFGYHRLEVLHREIEILIPERLRDRHRGHRAMFSLDPRVRPMGVDMQLSAMHKSGREFTVKINLAPMITTLGIFTLAVVRSEQGEKRVQSLAAAAGTDAGAPLTVGGPPGGSR